MFESYDLKPDIKAFDFHAAEAVSPDTWLKFRDATQQCCMQHK